MDFGNMTVLARETNFYQCCYPESWFIQTKQAFNRELGSLPSVYNSPFVNSAFPVHIYFSLIINCLLIVSVFPYLHWNFLSCEHSFDAYT